MDNKDTSFDAQVSDLIAQLVQYAEIACSIAIIIHTDPNDTHKYEFILHDSWYDGAKRNPHGSSGWFKITECEDCETPKWEICVAVDDNFDAEESYAGLPVEYWKPITANIITADVRIVFAIIYTL